MLVRQFPHTAPLLCFYVSAITPAERPFQSVTLRVFKDNEKLLEAEAPPEQLASAQKTEAGDAISGDKWYALTLNCTPIILCSMARASFESGYKPSRRN